MNFLSTGDFNFPFEWITYWVKHFYIWSFQTGTPNPDGLIRLPGRLFNFIAFGLLGNVGVSYFYIFSSLLIAFFAFFYFARHFLGIRNTSIQFIGALFFALNPIFLGNLAKVGLVLAAAMLPLCLLAIQAAFVRKRLRYFLLLFLFLNISFLHPYTFTVNLLVSGGYFLFMARQYKAFVMDNLPKLILIGIVGVLLNLYFVLPMASMGTVSKDIISTNVTPSPIDYTALVNVSNTGDFFTGFSLSKNIFKDFEFYDSTYQNVYFLGVFMFYSILLGLYLHADRRVKQGDKRQLGIFIAAFLLLIALAATTVMHIDVLIKFLISLPGGWAFRSPLKWQLYIPLVLFGALVVLLTYVSRKRLVLLQVLLLVTFLLMNGYLLVDVYRKILVPRTLTNFAALEHMDLDQKTVLFVNSGDCMDFLREHPRITTELNQVFTSKNTQLKHVLADNLDVVNVGSYDYVIGCKNQLTDALKPYAFKKSQTFADDTFYLFANQAPQPHIFIPEQIFSLGSVQNIGAKYAFVTQDLEDKHFAFTEPESAYPTSELQDLFENISPANVREGAITTTIPASHNDRQLYIKGGDKPLYMSLTDNHLLFSSVSQPGMQEIGAGARSDPINLPADTDIKVEYRDAQFDYKNVIRNPSLEQGLWQKKVTDCYAYDNKPAIDMRLSQTEKAHGRQSVQLEARQHIACTGPDSIDVRPGEHYLLHFSYQSLDGRFAGYNAGFDDPKGTQNIVRIQGEGQDWHTYSQEITVPKGASTMKLLFYAYPHTFGEQTSITRFDDVSLMKIPPAQDMFYLLDAPENTPDPPRTMSYTIVDPTKKTIKIQGASAPFFLASSESYSPLWRLGIPSASAKNWLPGSKTIAATGKDHFKLNGTMNGWYVDPAKLCSQAATCTKQNDGTYDFELIAEFTPQRWFYAGALVSSLTFVGCVVYFVRGHKRDRKEGDGYRWWR